MKRNNIVNYIILIFTLYSYNIFSQKNDINIEIKEPIKIVGAEEDDEVVLYRPSYLQFNQEDNNIYIADTYNHRIIILNEKFLFKGEFGRYGQGPVEFDLPTGISFDKNGNFIVTDYKNNRIQIIDKNFKYVSGFIFKGIPGIFPFTNVDSRSQIYLNMPAKGYVFSVFDKNGNEINQFGEIFKNDFSPLYQKCDNTVRFIIDDNDDIYCIFLNYPILRKYNKNFKLIYEINYEYLKEVKMKYKKWKSWIPKEGKQPNHYIDKKYTSAISFDDEYIYIVFDIDNTPTYVFKKDDGAIIKKIIFKDGEDILEFYSAIDFKSSKFIYLIDGGILYKFDK